MPKLREIIKEIMQYIVELKTVFDIVKWKIVNRTWYTGVISACNM